MLNTSPLGSVSFANTAMFTGVPLVVVAESFTATGAFGSAAPTVTVTVAVL